MPVIQISRIQVRRGLSTDLPQPNLAEGEFGLTLDTGELFIGAPNFPPVVGRSNYPYQNLRVLTEFSLRDLLSTLLYAYRFQDPDDSAFPGIGSYQADPSVTVERFLQERLDEVVSVKSYGAKGNGVDSDNDAIINACIDMYTNNYKPAQPRILYFPAGIYVIDEDALPIFEGTRWVGDGKGRTIIYLNNSNLAHSAGGYIRAVAETAEGDAGTVNRNANIVNPVRNVFISGMTLARSNVGDVMRLDRAGKGTFLDVEFKTAELDNGVLIKNTAWYDNELAGLPAGVVESNWPSSPRYNDKEHGICVRIDRLSALNEIVTETYQDISDDFVFFDCVFDSNTYGFYMVDSIDNVVVSSSSFNDLYKGVTLGEAIYYDTIDFLSTDTSIGDFNRSLPFDPLTTDVSLTGTFLDWDPTGVYSPLLNPTGAWGPQGFKVVNSSFRNILNTPFSVFSNRFGNGSHGNTYNRYGQGLMSESVYPPGPPAPTSPGVFFFRDVVNNPGYGISGVGTGDINVYLAQNNVSSGDVFDYDGPIDYLRVDLLSLRNLVSNPQNPINSPAGLTTGILHQTPMGPVAIQLASGASNETIITFNQAVDNAIVVDYTIARGTGFKKGELHIVSDGTMNDWYENVAEAGTAVDMSINVIDPGVSASGYIEIQFTDDTAGVNTDVGYMHWSARIWNHSFNDYNA